MTNQLHTIADALADTHRAIADQREIARAIIEAAEADGIDVKALRKAAKELAMDSDKRRAKYADEEALDLMRGQLRLFPNDTSDRRAA